MKRTMKALLIATVILALFSSSAAAFKTQPANITLLDRGVFYTYDTLSETADSLFFENGIVISYNDKVSVFTKDDYGNIYEIPFSSDMRLEEGMGFKIDRAAKVNISVDGQITTTYTTLETVGELLETMPHFSGTDYRVSDFLPNDKIFDEMLIKIGKVTENTIVNRFEIPFKTEIIENPEMLVSEEIIVQAGVVGIIQTETLETFLDNEKVSSVTSSSVLVNEPIDQIVHIGTKKPANMIAGNLYSKVLDVTSTAYTANESARTYTGIKPYEGVISVDPRVIPLGTRVYVEGYGEAIAADTGKSIKGNKIDVFYDTYNEAINYGVQSVKVYILE